MKFIKDKKGAGSSPDGKHNYTKTRIVFRDAWWSEAILRLGGFLLRRTSIPSRVGVPRVARSFLFGEKEVRLRV